MLKIPREESSRSLASKDKEPGTGLLYRGAALENFLITSVASGLPMDFIKSVYTREYGGEISEDEVHTILRGKELQIKEREQEINETLGKYNIVGKAIDAINQLSSVAKNTDDPKEISSILATMKQYLELFLKQQAKVRADMSIAANTVNVINNQINSDGKSAAPAGQSVVYSILEDLERQGAIAIYDKDRVKYLLGMTDKAPPNVTTFDGEFTVTDDKDKTSDSDATHETV